MRRWQEPLLGLLGALGAAVGLSSLWQWLQQRQAAEMEAAQLQAVEERYRFLRRLDHELKNPLTAMQIGLANLASLNQSPEAQHIQASIGGQIARISRLVSSLRKLADLEYAPLERLLLDPNDLLQEAFASTGDYAEAEQRRLRLLLPQEPLPLLEGDRDLLQLAIFNLLDNAIKFTRSGEWVELRAYASEGWLSINVRDTGRGIPPEDLPHVWEELYRSQAVHGSPGSGIGLALVKAIIEKHGGDVSISSSPGLGTTVTVELPLAQPYLP